MNSKTTTAARPAATTTPLASASHGKLITRIAERLGVDQEKLLATLKATAFNQGKPKEGKPAVEVTNEQMMALLVVADQYKLNPFTKEIYAFPDSNKGGIVPIVSVDGWIRIINERPELVSIEFEYSPEGSEDNWIACTIQRSDRSKPLTVREYLAECRRDTTPWTTHPRRMLRHKALIQAGRIAFGFAGIYDPDEAERIREARTIEGQVVSGKAGTVAPKAIEAPAEQRQGIDPQVVAALQARLEQFGVPESKLLAHYEVGSIGELHFDDVDRAFDWIPTAARDQ